MPDNYKILTIPFARDAEPSRVNEIPDAPDPIETQRASWEIGFPPVTMTRISAGGKPPEGPDFNGLFREITQHIVHQNKGGMYKFSPEVVAAGGYPKDSVLQSSNGIDLWISLIDGNINNPDVNNAGWAKFGSSQWQLVENGYVAGAGDRVYLNNRTTSPTLYLPASPESGQAVEVMPYPFTKFSESPLIVDGNGHRIMGINEPMNVDEDNAVFICKFISELFGWKVDRSGTAGTSFTITTTTGNYAPGAERTFDARIVQGAPMVMMVHGGAWFGGDKVANNLANGQYVALFPDKYGISFASINYTLATAGNYSYPIAVNDIIAAAEYFKAQGVPSITILGTSAGGNLAALAVIERPDLFDAFVGYYGVYDLTQTAQLDAATQSGAALYTDTPILASPTLQASGWNTPSLLIHGDADTTVNVQQSIDFGAAIGVTPIIVPGAAHAFQIFGPATGTLPDYGRDVFALVDKVGIK